MSRFSNESIFGEAADWSVWDVNVRVGPSGPNGHLGMHTPALLAEMSRFFIQKAVADNDMFLHTLREAQKRLG